MDFYTNHVWETFSKIEKHRPFFFKNFRQLSKNLDPIDQNRIRISFGVLKGGKVTFALKSCKKKFSFNKCILRHRSKKIWKCLEIDQILYSTDWIFSDHVTVKFPFHAHRHVFGFFRKKFIACSKCTFRALFKTVQSNHGVSRYDIQHCIFL